MSLQFLISLNFHLGIYIGLVSQNKKLKFDTIRHEHLKKLYVMCSEMSPSLVGLNMFTIRKLPGRLIQKIALFSNLLSVQ